MGASGALAIASLLATTASTGMAAYNASQKPGMPPAGPKLPMGSMVPGQSQADFAARGANPGVAPGFLAQLQDLDRMRG